MVCDPLRAPTARFPERLPRNQHDAPGQALRPRGGSVGLQSGGLKSRLSKGFVGYGDADPSNVSSMVHGAELRIAETRAVNRALRKAYGIGLCSVEELGAFSNAPRPSTVSSPSSNSYPSNGNGNGQPRLRDQLCLLIRQYNLDANLVKAYAADFCGTATLSGASRELVESFISHLAATAKENRDALVCKLNSYLNQLWRPDHETPHSRPPFRAAGFGQ